MRALSERFIHDLSNPGGSLFPLLTRVKKDQTLMLAIREGYINIYYRGGNILRVKEQKDDSYQVWFDNKYNISGSDIPISPSIINDQKDALNWEESFPVRKQIMDEYFSKNARPEREFQQLIARENNDSTISNESEYFITDIEFSDSDLHARMDMLAVQWRAVQRKYGQNSRIALIEMKYGDGALSGKAGLVKHLEDMDALISDKNRYKDLLQTVENQFDQLDRLGLLNFNKGSSNARIKLSLEKKPEVIFILANHNPRSTKLSSILDDPEVINYGEDGQFNLRFFVSKFAGYGLHTDCMLTLSQFRKLLK